MNAPGAIAMAGMAQKMANILHFHCPPNYQCGGPSYAALNSLDTMLHLMGVGVAVLQRKQSSDTEEYQKHLRENAITGPSIMETFTQHKAQILSGALYTMISDPRKKEFRESKEVTEEALLCVLQWYFKKTGANQEKFWEKVKDGTHDDLVQLETTL